MELTIKTVIIAVTLILGEITKKFNLVDKKYIPWQNLVIGAVSGLICWLCDLEPNLPTSFVKCIIASYAAGGIYDNVMIDNGDIKEDEI